MQSETALVGQTSCDRKCIKTSKVLWRQNTSQHLLVVLPTEPSIKKNPEFAHLGLSKPLFIFIEARYLVLHLLDLDSGILNVRSGDAKLEHYISADGKLLTGGLLMLIHQCDVYHFLSLPGRRAD